MTTAPYQDLIASIAARVDRDWFRIECKDGAKSASVYLYEEIGMWGTTAADFARQVADLDVSQIDLHLNSPGGSAWDGLAIMNTLRQHKANVVVTVDGIAASAASYIAMAGDEVVMAMGSRMMIHNSSGVCVGPSAEMRKTAEILDGINLSMAKIYAARAGGSEQQWLDAMAAETWYSAEEAVAAKLADRVDTAKGNDDKAQAHAADFAATIAAFLGRPVGEPAPKPPSASASGSRTTTQEGSPVVAFTDDQLTNMRQALGVAEDADEATMLAALTEALDERAEPAAEPAVPEGHVVVPAARLADLEANATLGAQAAEQLRVQSREAFLDSVRTKFLPTNREAWGKEFDRNPETTRAHFASAPDLIPTVEAGHDQTIETNADDAAYNALFGDDAKVG